jgi:hypothetical protein
MVSHQPALLPGQILYIPIQFNNTTKLVPKRVIFICNDEDGDPLFLKICSGRLRGNFYLIKYENYGSSLVYDSFVDCGQVYSKVCSALDLIAILTNDPKSILECLSDDDKEQISRWMNSANTISNIHKRLIQQAFS